MERIKALRQRKADLLKEADDLTAKEEELSAKDAPSDDEKAELETTQARLEAIVSTELPKLNKQIEREESLMDERRSMDATPDINQDTDAEAEQRRTPHVQVQTEQTGFKTFGEQLQAIAHAGQKHISHEEWDRRLTKLYQPGRGYEVAQGANESVPSEGGFLVQQDFAAPMFESMFQQGQILSRVRRVPISGMSNGLKMPAIDETSRVDGSRFGGVQGYWVNEGATPTSTQPKFRTMDLTLKKLAALFYATEELLADAAALETIAMQAFSEELVFKAEDAIVTGDGAGKPLGFLNSNALVTVSAESGQAASTIQTANVLNMFSRLPPRSQTRAVWLVNQDVMPQLWQLTLGSGTAVVLLYRPPGVDGPNVNAPFGTLLGRPVIPVEYCKSLGTKGDVLLVDPEAYLMIDKNGIQQAASMHVRFIYDEMTFRWTYRLDGEPMWRSAVTPHEGSASKSPYVALAART